MLSIRLTRFGKKNHATFRVVVMDHTKAPDAAPVERLGHYDPHAPEDKQFVINTERAQYWIDNGAQTTTTVASFLKKQGIEAPIRKKKTTKPKAKEEGAEEAAPASAASAEEAPKEEVKEEKAEKKEEKKEEPKEEKKEEKKEEASEEKKDEEKK